MSCHSVNSSNFSPDKFSRDFRFSRKKIRFCRVTPGPRRPAPQCLPGTHPRRAGRVILLYSLSHDRIRTRRVRATRVICRQERNYRERCRDVINSRAAAAASFPVTSRMIILTYVRRWRERDQDGIARRDRTRSAAAARGWRRMMWLGARTAKMQNNSSAEKMDESKCRGTS